MSNSEVITPWLPHNLESIHKHEEELRTRTVLEINADQNLKEQLIIIHESLNMIHDITKSYTAKDTMELTVQYLGARLFNSIIMAINLLLSGYYQGSVALQRDIVETGFLLDYFLFNKSEIEEWKNSSKKKRLDKFSPVKIRKALDDRDGFKGEKRKEIYNLMAEAATHPTYEGFKLLAPDGKVHLGPFYDVNYLRSLINELAFRVPLFTVIYISHFEKVPTPFLKTKAEYFEKIQKWSHKYLTSKLDITNELEQAKLILERIGPI